MQTPPSTSLSIVPAHTDPGEVAAEEDTPIQVRERLDPKAAHQLSMAEAQERVIRAVGIPRYLPLALQGLTLLLDGALAARQAADALNVPLRTRRPVHPGQAWAHLENAAQHAMQAYKVQLGESWPVERWQVCLTSIAEAAARERAWTMLQPIADGLAADSGSPEWWDAVILVTGMWGDRHYSSMPVVLPDAG
jgi:hypothetical protein